MTLTIDLSPELEQRLQTVARQQGVAPEECVQKVLAAHLPPLATDEKEDPTLALFAQWDAEDAQMTPEEVEAAQREFEEFKQNINAERARAGARRLF